MTAAEEAALRQENARLRNSNAALQSEVRRLLAALKAKEPKAVTLTPQMNTLLAFIAEYQRRHGVSPTYREMARGVGLASTGGVNRLVKCLEERGAIQRLHHRARALTIVAHP